MTWAEFESAVIEELSVDGNRRGIEALRTRAIRDAVIDLQRYIRAFRAGHTTRYDEGDLTEKGYAHLGTLPAQAKPKAFYVVSLVPKSDATLPNLNIARNRLDFIAWENRQIMISDRRGLRHYQYSISPFSTQFMVHPLINDETYLLVVWDGLKMTFLDGDVVPWPEQAAEAVAAYVKWKIALLIDKRPDLAREWFDRARNTGIYPGLRLALAREQRESQDADGKDEEYVGDSVTPPTGANLQSGSVNLAVDDVSAAIVFPTAYDALPIVDCWVVLPDGSAAGFDAWPEGDSITTTGFTAALGATVVAAGYKLYWRASAAS